MKFEDVVIKEYPSEVRSMFLAVWCLNRDIEYLRPSFPNYTIGLDLDLNSDLMTKVINGSIEEYINSLVQVELNKQHAFTRSVFEKSFNDQISDLFPKLDDIKERYDKINAGNDIIPKGILDKYAVIDLDGTILFDEEEYTSIMINETALKVDNEAQKDFYGKLDTFLEAYENLRLEVGDHQIDAIISRLRPNYDIKGFSAADIKERCKQFIEINIKNRR